MAIVKRLTKGSALTHAELDGNFTDLDGRVSTLESTSDNDNQTLSLAGTNLSISSGNTVDLSSLQDGVGIALSDLSVGADASASGSGGIAYNNTTGVFTYTPPEIPSTLTDLGIADGDAGDVLVSDGAGNFNFDPMYSNDDVDIHLRQTSANAGELLIWDGVDYQWESFTYFSLNDHSEVNFNGVVLDSSNGQGKVLAWDQTLQAFTPVDQTGSGSSYSDADVATYLNGNLDTSIIPDTNASYDLGSAEFKIRHLYLSNNSIYMENPLGGSDVTLQLDSSSSKLLVGGTGLLDTSTSDTIGPNVDINVTNHFVTKNAQTITLPNGTFDGQELRFWITGGASTYIDISITKGLYVDGAGAAQSATPMTWRLDSAGVGMYSCVWNVAQTAWVLSAGGPGA